MLRIVLCFCSRRLGWLNDSAEGRRASDYRLEPERSPGVPSSRWFGTRDKRKRLVNDHTSCTIECPL